MKKYQSFISLLKRFFTLPSPNGPTHRVANIEKTRDGNYIAIIQIIGKGITIKIKPEEILANDQLTNQFSPCDIRTLTYLGYLGINSPQYKILAQKLMKENNKFIFSLIKKDTNTIELKTADQISANKKILESLSQKDAHMIGYTTASENSAREDIIKKELIRQSIQKKLEEKETI